MITLNLTAKGTEQELIKKYLEENASETLADKINNGILIEKDDKTLINKKTLDGFMKYATDEAKKLAEKGALQVLVSEATLFSVGLFTISRKKASLASFITRTAASIKLRSP